MLLGSTAHGRDDPCVVNHICSERSTSGRKSHLWAFLSAVTLVTGMSITETLEAILRNLLQETSAPLGSEACEPRQLPCSSI